MVKIRLDRDDITPSLRSKERELERLPEAAYKIFRSHTPIDSGRARRSTVLRKTVIDAAYPYATQLDQGRSNQAPDGMTKPTTDFLRRSLDRIFKGS